MIEKLNKDDRFIMKTVFYTYMLQGCYTIIIGAILPMMRSEYNLSYELSGLLISVHSIGNIGIGLLASLLAVYIGIKKSFVLLNATAFAGLAIIILTGNTMLLIIAMLLVGIGRGALNNYGNEIINNLTGGNAGSLNLLGAFFAIGATATPFIVLFCTRNDSSGWKNSVLIIIILGIFGILASFFMKPDNSRNNTTDKNKLSLLFLKEKLYWLSVGIMFFYLCVEASVIGWIVTYLNDVGTISSQSSQWLASFLWFGLLVGRLACSSLANKLSVKMLLIYLSIGVAFFYSLLLMNTQMIPLLIATGGLGLCMSGMYSTTIANVAHILSKYSLALGVFITITGFGAIVMPAIVGMIAESFGINKGMQVIFVNVLLLLVCTFLNSFYLKKRMKVH